MIGATLQVDSDDRGGTRVSCVFPSKTVSDPS
jgi:hypothetical protein